MTVSVVVTVFVSIFITRARAVSVTFLVVAFGANNFVVDLIVPVGRQWRRAAVARGTLGVPLLVECYHVVVASNLLLAAAAIHLGKSR